MALDHAQEVTMSPKPEHNIAPSARELAAFLERCQAFHYSPKADILLVYPKELEPGFTIEPGDWLAWRVSYDRTRLIAVELHNFRAVVLRQHPQLDRAWKRYNNPLRRHLPLVNGVSRQPRQFLLDRIAALVSSSSDGNAGRLAHA